MKPSVLSVPVHSFRRIETPYERRMGHRNYVAVVDARHLPDLTKWRDINVRDAKTKGRVPNAIRSSFIDKPDEFFFMNRGMVIAAEKVDFRDESSEKHIDVVLRDPEIHGLLDGGHTYRVVQDEAKKLEEDDDPRYVRIEFITGFDRDTISEVVDARNTSNQVRDESLANLRQEFEPLKEILRDHAYFDLIAWSEYEELATGKPKPIDVRDIISYLITFDTGVFNNSAAQPMIAYKDKRACLRHFQDHQARLKKYYHLLPQILGLWDDIHANWAKWYGEGREKEAGIRGHFGKLTAISQDREETLYFKGGKSKYRMPEAYKYPILSALRAGVKAQGRGVKWATDPFQLLADTGTQLTTIVANSVRATNNPNKVGKDVGTWSSCYLVVSNALQGKVADEKERKIEELEAQIAELQSSHRRGAN
jgi:hypothetical protein